MLSISTALNTRDMHSVVDVRIVFVFSPFIYIYSVHFTECVHSNFIVHVTMTKLLKSLPVHLDARIVDWQVSL